MTPLDPNDPQSLQNGRYQLKGILGEGAMGRTYLAVDTQTHTELAIKALYPSRLATIKDLEMFEREAAVLKRLDHPQIPKYLDAFHEGEGESMCYFLAQTYVKGRTLRDMIDSGHRFDDDEFIQLAEHLLEVASYLHTSTPPVVHRDLKPANIIINPKETPVVVDFGAVREVVRLTMGGGSTIIGTYGYMPPEQLMGRSLPATDVYALGVTLVECLTRQTPTDLHGDDIKRLIEGVRGTDNLKRLLSRMCAPSLEDRFKSANEVLEDLRGLKGGVLVHTAKLEQEILDRERERIKELRKKGSQRAHIGYLLLVLVALSTAVVAIAYVGQALLVGVNTSIQLALFIGGAGLLMNLGLVGTRVNHDAWNAPQPDWKKATAKVKSVRQEQVMTENGGLETVNTLTYVFAAGSSLREHKRVLSRADYAALERIRDQEEMPKRQKALIDYIVAQFKEDHGIDIRENEAAMKRVKEGARIEALDREVTQKSYVVIFIPGVILEPRKDFRVQLTLSEYKDLFPLRGVIPKGYEFSVWYPPGKPELHDLRDIRKPGTDVMENLFSHLEIHTPE
jgi:hypothetical protein